MTSTRTDSTLPIRSVAIIGGGMGGLLLAQLIKRFAKDPIRVIIYERDEHSQSRDQGYILGIDESGMKALTTVFPNIDQFKAKDASQGFNLYGKDLHLWAAISLTPGMGISRRVLRDLLLTDVEILWNKKFDHYEEVSDGVIAYFSDGTQSEKVDLLVGADGNRSRVRMTRCPALKYDPIGVTSIYGSSRVESQFLPHLDSALKQGMTRLFGSGGSTILMMKFTDEHPDEILWVVTFRLSQYASCPINDQNSSNNQIDQQLLLDWVIQHARSIKYHPEVIKMIENTVIPTLTVLREIHSISPIKSRNPLAPSNRITLLGDAAHCMTTHRGRGANTTFEDAVDLATMITTQGASSQWLSALDQYETILFKRGFQNIVDSKNSSYMITMSGMSGLLRNCLIYTIGCIISIKRRLFH